MHKTKTSEKQTEFSTGMKRDTDESKPRFDLIQPLNLPYQEQMLTRWADLMARGCKHYGDRNWEKARTLEELARFIASAARHFEQWITGETDEDHAVAVFFNITGAEYVKWQLEKEKAGSPLEKTIHTVEALKKLFTDNVPFTMQGPMERMFKRMAQEDSKFKLSEIEAQLMNPINSDIAESNLSALKQPINKLRFFLDMDGVICDFVSGALKALNEAFDKYYTTEWYADTFGKWETNELYKISERTFWNTIHKVPDFWINLKPLPWAQLLYNKLSALGEVTIITTPSDDPNCAAQKIQWLRKHFNIKAPDAFIGGKKYFMAGNGILIDDNQNNIKRFIEAGGEAILIPSSWNDSACDFEIVWSVIQKYLDNRELIKKPNYHYHVMATDPLKK